MEPKEINRVYNYKSLKKKKRNGFCDTPYHVIRQNKEACTVVGDGVIDNACCNTQEEGVDLFEQEVILQENVVDTTTQCSESENDVLGNVCT